MDLLTELTAAIKADGFTYSEREAEGVQTPAETLRLRVGSCRDFALLMIEAARALNFAARFVSGYLYVPRLDANAQQPAQATQRDGDPKPASAGSQQKAASAPAAPSGGAARGGGATHAWVQIYLPGAGWVEFDPTNAIVGNRDLIRVAVARDPAQAVPLTGSWTGAPSDFLGLSVDVRVSTLAYATENATA